MFGVNIGPCTHLYIQCHVIQDLPSTDRNLMGLLRKYSDKLYLKQWGIGFLKGDLADIIRNKRTDLHFDWMPLDNPGISYADPFIFRTGDGLVNILFESVSSYTLNGKISLMVCNDRMEVISQKEVLDTHNHLSYPFVYRENGKIYVFPENAFSGGLYCYEFDQVQKTLGNKRMIMDVPVIDPTIIKHDNIYWLFASLLGPALNSELHIFYSDNLFGPYAPHEGNPVKTGIVGSRPAGDFIHVDGAIYRPSQNSRNYYGESMTIQKVTTLTKKEYREEAYMVIGPARNGEFNYGIHTINAAGNIIIADGLKSYFQPVQQLSRKIKNIFN